LLVFVRASALHRLRPVRLVPALLAFALPVLFTLPACRRGPERVSNVSLHQDIYVWQRTHHAAVADSVRTHAGAFGTTVVLLAEVAWEKPAVAAAPLLPRLTRVAADWSALATVPRLGLALRINAHPGPFSNSDATARALTTLARELLATAADHGVTVAELQIDFDAATAKLAGYRLWLSALRDAAAPVPVVFTALPAWLRSDDFPALARTTGQYVLQVHSLTRPAGATSAFTLCDPGDARTAIERAARLGVPFRVALPTYGYTLAFDPAGRFAGLSAEGPEPAWLDRPGYTLREVSADSAALTGLVRALAADRPAALTGLIWYRLPISGDRLNWSWPMLSAVMAGRAPTPHLSAVPHPDDHGLVELALVNTGEGDFAGPVRLAVRWTEARRLAADALNGFAIAREDAASLQLATSDLRLAAGESRPVGWLRLSSPASAHVTLETAP
jgi:hypothetical protein